MLFHVSKKDEDFILFANKIPKHIILCDFDTNKQGNIIKYNTEDQINNILNNNNVKYVAYSKEYEKIWKPISFMVSFTINTNEEYSINLTDTNDYDSEKNIHNVNLNVNPLVFLRNIYTTVLSTAYYNENNLLVYIGNRDINKPIIMRTEIPVKVDKYLCNNVYRDNTVQKIKNNYNICLIGDWIYSKELRELWSRYCIDNYKWENITIVDEEHTDIDFFVIINRPNFKNKNVEIPSSKCIIFHMEPNMLFTPWYNEFITKFNSSDFVFNGLHKYHRNNIDWHLSKNFNELVVSKFNNKPKGNTISMILTSRRDNIGHIMRLNLAKRLDDSDMKVDIYGKCKDEKYKNYKGELEYYHRETGLFDYKYHFMAENTAIDNYFTEKITDCILSETLCFYWGCPNLEKFIDEKCFIRLPLNDIEESMNIIKKSIENNEWEKRIEYIRTEKQKILHIYSLFPRLQSIIKLNLETEIIFFMKEQNNELRDKLVDMSFKNLKMKKVEEVSIIDLLQLANYAVSNNKNIIALQSIKDNLLYDRVCDTLSIIKHANISDKLVFCYTNENEIDKIFSQDFYISNEAAKNIMNIVEKNNINSLTSLFEHIKPARIKYIY